MYNQTVLIIRERIVMITPAFVYSQKVSSTFRRRADSATIKFATDPSKVRFPASVEAAARVSHPAAGAAIEEINGRSKSTAGTLETRLLSTTVMRLRLITFSRPEMCM